MLDPKCLWPPGRGSGRIATSRDRSGPLASRSEERVRGEEPPWWTRSAPGPPAAGAAESPLLATARAPSPREARRGSGVRSHRVGPEVPLPPSRGSGRIASPRDRSGPLASRSEERVRGEEPPCWTRSAPGPPAAAAAESPRPATAPAPSPREARRGSGVRSHRVGPEVPLAPRPRERPNRHAPRPRGERPTRVARRERGIGPLQTIAPPARTPALLQPSHAPAPHRRHPRLQPPAASVPCGQALHRCGCLRAVGRT